MHFRLAIFAGSLVLALFANPPAARAQDEKVFRQLSAEQMENLLKTLNVEYKKVDGKKPDIYFYDFERNRYKIRLHYFNGKDIMLDATFKDYPLERLNEWNTKAKFSRAALHRDKEGPFTALEANLDVIGGVTLGTIEQLFKTFDEELKSFDRFLTGVEPPGTDEKIVTVVSDEMLEKVLDGLKLKFKKNVGKGATNFDFEAQNHMLRMTNFGGKDLMIDAQFKVIPLDKINKYNIDNKFIRAVLYKTNNNDYVALESNLDCAGGVTESIVRYFVNVFDKDVKKFSKYVQDNRN